jgi:PAS domain S-box-containing protein
MDVGEKYFVRLLSDSISEVSNLHSEDYDAAKQESANASWLDGPDKYRTFFMNSADPMQMIHGDMFVECNHATAVALGYDTPEKLLNVHPAKLSPEYQLDGEASLEKGWRYMEIAHAQGTHRFEWDHLRKNGDVLPVEVTLTSVSEGGERFLYSLWRDITERRKAEEIQKTLEGQLRQSEKMKAVGQLAGGVAHDFNNLLQAMLGHVEIAIMKTSSDSETVGDLNEVIKAANRAKVLVRQLLAFGRRQVLKLEVLDLDEVIEDFASMIRRMIGEHITFGFQLEPGQKMVRADRGQIEQVLMNLCVNARDSMLDGGSLVIESENVELGSDFCSESSWATPGDYVLLTIRDTGIGMDGNTQKHLFEPFFTTREEGTGLGLSTVYGIVRQHNGMIRVASEVGEGTTFKVYLPKSESLPTQEREDGASASLGGTEVILLAEDEESVRVSTQRLLEAAGYTVLSANDGEGAIRLFDDNALKVNIAMLDVVMPGVGGRAVFDHIRDRGSQIPILFATGYSPNSIHTNFVLDEGLQLIRKPFQREALLKTVRTSLDS